MPAAYLAIDWGTTNRSVYAMSADGEVLAHARDDRGILALERADYPHEIASLRRRFGDVSAIVAGMAGSTRGWREVPYVPAPADLPMLAAAMPAVDELAVRIVPGVSLRTATRADVMRGEEVQVLGAIAAGLAPGDAIFCQPGTHNKWIRTVAAQIADFTTVMTGELFALLRGHGVLAGMLDGVVADGDAFRAGVARGLGAPDLAAALFEIRASVLLGALPADDAAAFASGLLIGHDVGTQADLNGRDVCLLGSGTLAALYAAVIDRTGGRAVVIDSAVAFAAGIHQLWKTTG